MRRGQDAAAGSNGAGGGSGGRQRNSGSTSTQCTMKILVPEAMAPAIIGKGGSVIAAIRQSCQAKVQLSDQGELYMQTDCRVLTAQAEQEESLNEVFKQVLIKIAELSRNSDASEEGNLNVKILVPRSAVSGIIGKGGATIKQIREDSGAKISVSGKDMGSGPGLEQLLTIAGTTEAIEHVMLEVNKRVQALKTEPWFPTWAATTGSFQAAGASSQGGGGGSAGVMLGLGGMPMADGSGIDIMMRVAQGLPPYVMEDSRGFALSCVVPDHLVGGLIGRGGAGTREIQAMTGAKIAIRDLPDDPENRTLSIAGPLPSACAAYMLMMKRYLDAEAQGLQSSSRQRPR